MSDGGTRFILTFRLAHGRGALRLRVDLWLSDELRAQYGEYLPLRKQADDFERNTFALDNIVVKCTLVERYENGGWRARRYPVPRAHGAMWRENDENVPTAGIEQWP